MYHKEDLIDVLLRIQQEGSLESPVSMETIKFLIFDILAGGSETVTTVLQWAMTELMRNPTVMSKAQDEVREVFKWKKMVSNDDINKLTYLQFVIKETVRLHTPGPLFMRECQEQCQVMGYDVPKGTKFLLNLWSISRDPKYWDDPETFKPERFENDARDFKGNDFEFIPFGAGRRMCPGMLFGLANIELALANLLFYFDWSLPDGVLPSELDMTENFGVTVRKKEDLLLHASLYAQLSC
jgi:cytochrome P450